MINNRAKAVQVCRYISTVNEYNEEVKELDTDNSFTVDMAISLNTGNTQSIMNVLAAHSTHTGITRDAGITMKDIIKDGNNYFAIDYMTQNRNLYILNLRQVEQL